MSRTNRIRKLIIEDEEEAKKEAEKETEGLVLLD